MRETALIIPVLNCQNLIEDILDSALRQTVNPYRIVVADGGSIDRTVDLARRIGKRAISAGLLWFGFDLVESSSIKSAVDESVGRLRSDCVVISDMNADLASGWVGSASVALYSVPEETTVHTVGAVAFHRSQWPKIRPSGAYAGASGIRGSRSRQLVLGATNGSYVLQ